jgi:hypothetical protein
MGARRRVAAMGDMWMMRLRRRSIDMATTF